MIKSDTLKSKQNTFYLNSREIEIIKLVSFNLAKVRYLEEKNYFYIDENLLTENKQNEITICLDILKGV